MPPMRASAPQARLCACPDTDHFDTQNLVAQMYDSFELHLDQPQMHCAQLIAQ